LLAFTSRATNETNRVDRIPFAKSSQSNVMQGSKARSPNRLRPANVVSSIAIKAKTPSLRPLSDPSELPKPVRQSQMAPRPPVASPKLVKC
jgi:hypothetical protein